MFANRKSIEMLVKGDRKASDEEKVAAIAAINGRALDAPDAILDGSERAVVSIEEATRILGFRNRRAVHSAIRRGTLKGCSCGSLSKRSYGVTVASIRRVLGR